MTPLRQRYIEDLRARNKSPRTIETYVLRVAQFAKHFGRSPELLGPEDLRAYQQHLITRQVSWSMFNQTVCALRFLYQVSLGRPEAIKHLPFAKRPRLVPTVLSPEEVAALLQATLPGRERTLLDVIYSCGLRLKEVLGLKVGDIDSARMVLHIRQGKGQKERLVPLSPRLLALLRGYWRECRPATWLFPGIKATLPLTDGTVQRICKRTAKRAGLTKRIHPHTFRHYADSRIMPTQPQTSADSGGISRIARLIVRHNQRASKKANSLSSGRNRPGFASKGAIFARAFSLRRKSAWRYICVVSTDSCPSQSAITERSMPCCRSFMAAVWRST